MSTDILATTERQEILDSAGIKWKFDQDFNFYFDTKRDEEKAIKVLKAALEL